MLIISDFQQAEIAQGPVSADQQLILKYFRFSQAQKYQKLRNRLSFSRSRFLFAVMDLQALGLASVCR